MSPSWWRENPFMHTKFCCLRPRPGEEPPPPAAAAAASQLKGNPTILPTIPCVSLRFKTLLQNRPAAENTCIEISHVKYNIFHVRQYNIAITSRHSVVVMWLLLCLGVGEGCSHRKIIFCVVFNNSSGSVSLKLKLKSRQLRL